ncbi:hypothetical protein [Acidicapsa ligni]|uniref:hypothetical protein n=1 Tax=Acidicapsa ligni TaxID=542300 RepID=UPI0021E0ACD8|nr:hypothetical protein [Acidicapsa ligni]
MKKYILALLLAISLAPVASIAQVVVQIRPPAPVYERRGRPPGVGYIWIGGYQRWDGRRYVWTPGRWDRPPRRGARWIAPRWERRRGRYVFHDGRWR